MSQIKQVFQRAEKTARRSSRREAGRSCFFCQGGWTVGPYSLIILSQGTTPDLNGDGRIDLKDFAVVAGQWQQGCDAWECCEGADFNVSGTVDIADIWMFLLRWLDGAEDV